MMGFLLFVVFMLLIFYGFGGFSYFFWSVWFWHIFIFVRVIINLGFVGILQPIRDVINLPSRDQRS